MLSPQTSTRILSDIINLTICDRQTQGNISPWRRSSRAPKEMLALEGSHTEYPTGLSPTPGWQAAVVGTGISRGTIPANLGVSPGSSGDFQQPSILMGQPGPRSILGCFLR